jgi:hypothetical protein
MWSLKNPYTDLYQLYHLARDALKLVPESFST